MKLKRIAVRTAVVLVVVIALCMFFGQTVLTLTTPKVKIAEASNGRFEDKIKVTAELYFEKPEAFTLDEAKDLPVTIESVWVSPGDSVRAGDTLFTCRLQGKYEEEYERIAKAIADEQAAALKTEADNRKVSTKNTSMNDAENALTEKQAEYTQTQAQLVALAATAGVTLKGEMATWREQIGEKTTEEIDACFAALETLEKSIKTAQDNYLDLLERGQSRQSTYDYLKKKGEHEAKIEKERENLVELVAKSESLKTVRAPRDGVVVKVDVVEGETYNGDKAAFSLSRSEPMLRADITDKRKEIARDMRVEYKGEYETVRSTILDVVRESGNKRYAIIEMTDELLSYGGDIRGLTQQPIELSIVYKAKGATTLLPASAVRGEENNYYVYVAEERYGRFGIEMIARKMDVSPIEHSDKVWSIEEDLSYQRIIMQNNAAIDDGSRVMEYLQ